MPETPAFILLLKLHMAQIEAWKVLQKNTHEIPLEAALEYLADSSPAFISSGVSRRAVFNLILSSICYVSMDSHYDDTFDLEKKKKDFRTRV